MKKTSPQNKPAKVLYLGALTGTSLNRLRALQELCPSVIAIDPRRQLPESKWIDRIIWHLSPKLLAPLVAIKISRKTADQSFDLVFVDSGSLVTKKLLTKLKRPDTKLVNYNHDDPFGSRDWRRFSEYRRSVPAYDLIVVVRRENIQEAKNHGAKKVLFQFRVADDTAHSPIKLTEADEERWASEVAFIGTWMPGRGEFLYQLIKLGVPISVYGSGWSKSSYWNQIKHTHRADHLDTEDYRKAIQAAKICLGLLSHANRDKHTTRSIEIPMLGGLLCAENTDEHRSLYNEGEEAVFWQTPEECANKCLSLLDDKAKIAQIKQNGRARAIRNALTTKNALNEILDETI
jgi:hypothetical protein